MGVTLPLSPSLSFSSLPVPQFRPRFNHPPPPEKFLNLVTRRQSKGKRKTPHFMGWVGTGTGGGPAYGFRRTGGRWAFEAKGYGPKRTATATMHAHFWVEEEEGGGPIHRYGHYLPLPKNIAGMSPFSSPFLSSYMHAHCPISGAQSPFLRPSFPLSLHIVLEVRETSRCLKE